MKISKKFSKKLKKTFDIYNIAIIGCVFLIVLSVYIIVKPDKKTSENGIEIIQTDIKKSEEISEKEAKKVAQKQFKKLGEKVKHITYGIGVIVGIDDRVLTVAFPYPHEIKKVMKGHKSITKL